MLSKYSDSRRCAAAFIRFAMDRFDHDDRVSAIAYRNYFINDRKLSGFPNRKDDAVVLRHGVTQAVARLHAPSCDLRAPRMSLQATHMRERPSDDTRARPNG